MSSRATDEARIAEEILSVLPAGRVVRVCCDDRRMLRYSVHGEGMKLRTIVLDRAALRRLGADPARAVKVEYLQRDLQAASSRRAEFRYPRVIRRGATALGVAEMALTASAR